MFVIFVKKMFGGVMLIVKPCGQALITTEMSAILAANEMLRNILKAGSAKMTFQC